MRTPRYEPAKGVVALEWQHAEPTDAQGHELFLLETWRATVSFSYSAHGIPQTHTQARIRVARKVDASWWVLGNRGEWIALPSDENVRRHASLNSAMRHRWDDLTLAGWS